MEYASLNQTKPLTLNDRLTTLLTEIQGVNNFESLINQTWTELCMQYGEKQRFYHTLTHLENLYHELAPIQELFKDWQVIQLTLFFHDWIYDPKKTDNEVQSANVAASKLLELGVNIKLIEMCKEQIIATKSHQLSADSDTNFFLDADLSVLGKDWETYETYYKNVRQEYSMYPNFLYKPGRKKVLKHFLDMKQIYKTSHFYSKYEAQAKLNLQRELNLL